MSHPSRLEVVAWPWPEIAAGEDLGRLVAECPDLRNGDVVVVTSKVVSKAEGRARTTSHPDLVGEEMTRLVARRGETLIAETRHGLVMAAAGVDASNVAAGTVLALPLDPDRSARDIRSAVWEQRGLNVGVVITDTAGRAWRVGQTDLAIGCAGLPPILDLSGTTDAQGRTLHVTAPALADEVAGAADLVKGKSTGRPLAVVRGLSHLVERPGMHGPGAAALIRRTGDLFALGSRDAVIAAVRRGHEAQRGFSRPVPGDPPPFAAIASDRSSVRVTVLEVAVGGEGTQAGWAVVIDVPTSPEPADWVETGRIEERLDLLAAAHRLRRAEPGNDDITPASVHSRLHWFVA